MVTPLPFACACEERLGLSLSGFADLAGKTALLFDETRYYHGDPDAVRALGHAVAALRRLCRRLETPLWRYRVAVTGLSAAGVDALFTFLLHCDVSFRLAGPWADIPFEFHYGADWSVTLHRAAGPAWPVLRCTDSTDVAARLEDAFATGCLVTSPLHKVVIKMPAALLRRGLALCDVPPYRTVTDDADASPPPVPGSYLRTEVAHLVWVASADEITGATSSRTGMHPNAGLCSDVVVIGAGGLTETHSDSGGQTVGIGADASERFGCLCPAVRVAPSCAVDPEAPAVPVLAERIRELADPDARIRDIAADWERLGEAVRAWFTRREREGGAGRQRWRPDSWARWVGSAAASPVGRAMAETLSGPYAAGPDAMSLGAR